MISFWLIISLLTIVALTVVVWPLLFGDVQTKPSYLLAAIIFICTPISAYFLYYKQGNSEAVTKWLVSQKKKETIKNEIAKFGSRQNIIIALRHKLEQLPANADSAKGWYILGKLYFNENNIDEAIHSFRRAYTLKPEQPEYMLQFVSVDFYKKQALTPETITILKKLLALSPNNSNAINLLALDAYQHKNYAEAIHQWEKLLSLFPPDSEDSKNLLAMIQEAQKQETLQNGTALEVIEVTIQSTPEIDTLRDKNAVLFIYALEAGGPKIPLAAIRLAKYQFPLKITLDSSQNMMPGRSLVNASKVYVEARISASGNAMPQKGDLVGDSSVFLLKKRQSVAVMVNKVL